MSISPKEVMERICPMNEDEKFYQAYYQAGKSTARLRQFLASVNPEEIRRRHLIVPEISPHLIPYSMDDTEYFESTDRKSVYISRHNRYTPAFLHKHAFFEVVYVLSGHCTQTIGLQTRQFQQGAICFVAPETFHTMEVFDDSLVFNFLLRRSTFYEMFHPLTRNNDLLSAFFSDGLYSTSQIQYIAFQTGSDPFLVENILKMYADQMEADIYTDQILVGFLTMIFAYLMRHYQDTMESSYSHKITQPDNYLVMNYIQEHLNEVSLSDVAEQFGFSVSYCSRLIKSSTGQGFNDWKRILRLRRAEHLLLNTTTTVADISASLGYANPETFIRTFKKEFHLSPTQYRRQAKE